jgi:UDPglucose--hexose-1-phosphate uridylyltransferase
MELRRDYILDRWVIIAERRGKRPHDFAQNPDVYPAGKCYFCPGNENETPPEIGRIEKDGKWKVRWFPNKFSFIEREGSSNVKTADNFFTYSNPFGGHEVIAETDDHSKQLHDLSVNDIRDVLGVYSQRIIELSKKDEYVVVFKNHGTDAGTSIAHSHSQVASVNILPPNILDECSRSIKDGRCLYCDIISIEKNSYRRTFENERFVAFCPYASRFNFEIWIFPKAHIRSITEMDATFLQDLADLVKRSISKLAELKADYNLCVHYAPKSRDLHFHIEIMPRLAKWAGFELSSGIIVNQVSPEEAARFYRGE